MTSFPRSGRDGLHHPRDEDEIASLVHAAARSGQSLRVRGAAHSVPSLYQTDLRQRGFTRGGLDLSLDRLAHVAIDVERREVDAGAGVHFGRDPRDRTGRAIESASLCHALERRGLALPVLGGVSQQTVAGFLATGSEGGSLTHALSAQLVGLTLVDGTGRVRELDRDRDRDLFLAAGTSLGMLGVVTRARFRVVPRFDVVGSEQAIDLGEGELDLLARGSAGLASFMRDHEYARVLWWPQPGVDRLVVWKGAQTREPGTLVPYRPFPPLLGSTLPMQAAAGGALAAIDRALGVRAAPARAVLGELAATAYRAFVPVDDAPRPFRDAWHRAIPLDDEIDERLLPTSFTEIWVPIDAAAEAMRRLREHYALGGFAATSSFVTELYAAPSSPFLIHPGHGRDSVRINAFWFGRNAGAPAAFFEGVQERLWDLDARLHWGKHLFATPQPARLLAHHPRWREFLDAREELDPGQVFVNDYLRAQLGIAPRPARVAGMAPPPSPRAPEAPIHPRSPATTRALPLAFQLEPTDASYIGHAKQVFDHCAILDATPEVAFEVFTETLDGLEWVEYLRGVEHLTEDTRSVGSVVDEAFVFMTLRMRIVARDAPFHQLWSVDACTLPLATRMLEEVTLTPRPDGRTDFRWRIHYDPLPALRLFQPGASLFFDRMFARSTERLTAYLAARARNVKGGSARAHDAHPRIDGPAASVVHEHVAQTEGT